jgi:hypothetical protein
MKNNFRNIIALGLAPILLLLASCSKSNDLPGGSAPEAEILIAHYPLSENGNDLTGLNAAMTLRNAPFLYGGIFCNGIYVYSPNTDYCLAESPPINSFPFESFSISMDFFVTEKVNQPVWVIGKGCRWLGFYLSVDGTVELLYNNSNHLLTPKSYTINEWHNAKISYDGAEASIFLDNSLAGTLKFGNGYVPLDYGACGTADTEIGVTNYSNGVVFRGYVKNLKVYRLK